MRIRARQALVLQATFYFFPDILLQALPLVVKALRARVLIRSFGRFPSEFNFRMLGLKQLLTPKCSMVLPCSATISIKA